MALKAQGISKRFTRSGGGSFFAVKETDLELRPGELTVLMGRSGSGKSTLLNMLAGLSKPTAGRIFLEETDLYSLNDKELSKLRNRQIGVIPQGQTALHSLTVRQNMCLPGTMFNKENTVNEYADELLELLGIGLLGDSMPAELSGGELRRMSIARALINRPKLILADEPTGDLDDENTAIVFYALKQKAREGAAVLVVTHETGAESYADIMWRMNGGVLSFSG